MYRKGCTNRTKYSSMFPFLLPYPAMIYSSIRQLDSYTLIYEGSIGLFYVMPPTVYYLLSAVISLCYVVAKCNMKHIALLKCQICTDHKTPLWHLN